MKAYCDAITQALEILSPVMAGLTNFGLVEAKSCKDIRKMNTHLISSMSYIMVAVEYLTLGRQELLLLTEDLTHIEETGGTQND